MSGGRQSALLRAVASGKSGSMALAQTLLVRFITLGLNLVTGIVSARFLGPVGRAEQAAILLGAGFLPFLFSLGLPLATQYRVRTDPERANEYISAALGLTISLGAVTIVAGVVVLPHMLVKYSASVTFAAQLAMLSAPITMLYALLCAILQARGRFRETNATRYGMPALTLLLLGILIVMHRLSAFSSSIAYLITGFVAVPWLWFIIAPRLRFRGLRVSTSMLLSFGSRSYVSDILGTLAAQVDQVLVIGLLTPASMGLYTVALGAARAVDVYSASVVAVLFPRATALEDRAIVELTGRAARITSLMLLLTAVILIISMPIVLPLFYGRAFVASVPVARVIVVSFALNAVVYVLAQAFLAAGRPGVNAIVQLIGLGTAIPAMLMLIPRFSLLGAAYALVISTSIRLITSLACFPLVLKQRAPSLVLNRADVAYMRDSLRTQTSGGENG